MFSQSPEERDDRYMRAALEQARSAIEHGDVPVGAIVVREDRIIGRGHNQREMLADPTAHAEMIAITAAAQFMGDWRLEQCTLFVTLEPCVMCAGAVILARVPRVVFGASDAQVGACGSLFSIHDNDRLNHRAEVSSGVLATECADLLREFFKRRRREV